MKTPSIINSKNYMQYDSVEIGGKAKNLFSLSTLQLNVPKWIVLPFDTLQHINDPSQMKTIRTEISNQFTHETFFAVRSSANVEDAKNYSFAGQFKSILFVTKENLISAIKEVFESKNTELVKTYCTQNNIDPKGIKMSVIVQEMINSDVSGVGFGINPVTGNPNMKIINATWGIGEGLVDGSLNADLYELIEGKTKVSIVEKVEEIKFDINTSKLVKKKIDRERTQKQTLSKTNIKELEKTLNRLENHFGHPQDIEFAILNNSIFYLQTRPVTTKIDYTTSMSNKLVWDNSNIVESYPGHSSPLTFSFIRRVYEAVYLEFALLMGVSSKTIKHNQDSFRNMLGLIKGRVYYNLTSWYSVLSLFPGYSINAGFMEKMMGVKEKYETPKRSKPNKNYLGLIKSIISILISFFSLSKKRDTFLKLLDETINEMDSKDFRTLNDNQLLQEYSYLEETLLHNWKAPLVNDFFAMIFYGSLDKVSKKWLTNKNLHNALLIGSSDIISVEPIRYLEEIKQSIRENESTSQIFTDSTPKDIWTQLLQKQHSNTFHLIKKYIQKFGDRSMGELKLETVTYKQDPASFILYIKNALAIDFKPQVVDPMILRNKAEIELYENLKRKPVKRLIYQWILKHSRKLISNRENLRFERTRAFGQVRRVYSAIGSRWESANILEFKEDIFFLTIAEINDYIKGMSVNTDLKALVELRKNEYKKWEQEDEPSDRFETIDTVYYDNEFINQKTHIETNEESITGVGASSGVTKAKVRIVNDPKEIGNLNGEIMIAKCTDPSWVTLFPSASGILVERGSMLSHSAIVAREMGIPCIVGLSSLFQNLKTGDLVEMNGGTGQIKILKRA